MNWDLLSDWLNRETGISLISNSRQAAFGGNINEAWSVETSGGGSAFVKLNAQSNLDLFEAETTGLNLLRATETIRVPEPYACGVIDGHAVLVMEGIQLRSWQDAEHQEKLGLQLAALHEHTAHNGKFGADFDNHIGRTPQHNQPKESWVDFFIEHRLDWQFQLATKNGWNYTKRDELFSVVRDVLHSYETPAPTLLHGDLWSGNAAFDEVGNPVIFDPACYYGDREADIAFTGMFGGFSTAFYRAYREIHPAPENVEWLHRLYNLYHELNHFNLFGGGYREQSEQTIRYLM